MSWRTPITLLVLLGVLLGAAYYGWQTIASSPKDEPDATTKAGACTKTVKFHKGQRFVSSDVTVNVYNAGSIGGLAGDTLSGLHDQGFGRGTAENAPAGVTAHNVTILTQFKTSPQSKLVASQFRGKVQFAKGPALATGTDIIVGDSFKGLDPHAKKFIRITKTVKACAPTGKAG